MRGYPRVQLSTHPENYQSTGGHLIFINFFIEPLPNLSHVKNVALNHCLNASCGRLSNVGHRWSSAHSLLWAPDKRECSAANVVEWTTIACCQSITIAVASLGITITARSCEGLRRGILLRCSRNRAVCMSGHGWARVLECIVERGILEI